MTTQHFGGQFSRERRRVWFRGGLPSPLALARPSLLTSWSNSFEAFCANFGLGRSRIYGVGLHRLGKKRSFFVSFSLDRMSSTRVPVLLSPHCVSKGVSTLCREHESPLILFRASRYSAFSECCCLHSKGWVAIWRTRVLLLKYVMHPKMWSPRTRVC